MAASSTVPPRRLVPVMRNGTEFDCLLIAYSGAELEDGGEWEPGTKENPNFMIFKLDENDNENSELGQPITKLPWE